MKRFWFILVAMLGLATQAVPASADVQYTLNCSGQAANCTGGNANFNFGTVTLSTPSAGNVHVVVQLASGYSFGNTNNLDSFYWNTNLSGASSAETVSNLTGTFDSNGLQSNGSYAAGSYFSTGGNNFDFFVERDNGNSLPTSLSFDVTRSGGLTLANFASGNDSGVFYFAAQIRTTLSSTLFWVASNKAGVNIPEPGTMTLSIAALGSLMGLVMLQRRRKLARA